MWAMSTLPPPRCVDRARTLAVAAVIAIGTAILLLLGPPVAGVVASGASIAVVDVVPGDARPATEIAEAAGADLVLVVPSGANSDLGYHAAVRIAVVIAVLAAAGFAGTLIHQRRRRARTPVLPSAPARPAPLPDDVLAAVPGQVTAVTSFGPHGGFVDAGGVLVWAALTRPGEPVAPGRTLTVLSSSHERDSLLVSLRAPQKVRP
jgi:hypothetical protein